MVTRTQKEKPVVKKNGKNLPVVAEHVLPCICLVFTKVKLQKMFMNGRTTRELRNFIYALGAIKNFNIEKNLMG